MTARWPGLLAGVACAAALALAPAAGGAVGGAAGGASSGPGAAGGRDGGAERVFRFVDPAIPESSGLVVVGDRVVTVNDSGNDAVLFVVDPATGRTERTVRFAVEQVDVEALAAGPSGQVWVGDIGDNAATRSDISVVLVSLATGGATTYSLAYPRNAAYDAEALLADPRTGRLWVVTKGLLGGRVFAAPRQLATSGTNRLTLVGRAPALVTDGAFLPGGRRVVLRDYGSATVLRAADWAPLGTLALPDQPQGEAVAAAGPGDILVSSEGARTPVWRVPLPAELLAGRDGADAGPGGGEGGVEDTAAPDPGQGASDAAGGAPRWVPNPVWAVAGAVAAGIGLAWWVRRRRSR